MSTQKPQQGRYGLLFPEDVAHIWTEEARAEDARKFVAALKDRTEESLRELPDVSRRTPRSDVDQAVMDTQAGLRRVLDTQVSVEQTEQEVVDVIDDIHARLQDLLTQFAGFNRNNPHVRLAKRELAALNEMIKDEEGRDRRVVSLTTVHSYVTKSRPTKPGVEPARYAAKPVPEPRARRGVNQPAWEAEQEPDLRAWWRTRPGRGAGGGRPRKHPRPTPE